MWESRPGLSTSSITPRPTCPVIATFRMPGLGFPTAYFTSQFLYLVVKDLAGARLLKIRVRDLLDESEAVIEPAGTVVSYPLITGTIGQSLTLYRDNLVVVNRRLVGLSNTAYFEITGV